MIQETKHYGSAFPRRKTLQVRVRNLYVGSKHPVVVQSMTNTDTGDVSKTVAQIIELYKAGSEMVRFTVAGRKDGEGCQKHKEGA